MKVESYLCFNETDIDRNKSLLAAYLFIQVSERWEASCLRTSWDIYKIEESLTLWYRFKKASCLSAFLIRHIYERKEKLILCRLSLLSCETVFWRSRKHPSCSFLKQISERREKLFLCAYLVRQPTEERQISKIREAFYFPTLRDRLLRVERTFFTAHLLGQTSERREKLSLCLPYETDFWEKREAISLPTLWDRFLREERSYLSAYLMRQISERREKLSLCLPYETDFWEKREAFSLPTLWDRFLREAEKLSLCLPYETDFWEKREAGIEN